MKPDVRILVTGAGGFIGGWLVEALCLCGIGRVRAGIRRWSSGARIGRFPIEIVLCDVLNKDQVQRATADTDAVVHCSFGSRDVTVKGTENMLIASFLQGVKKFIHLSTVDVYGEVEGNIDETFPCRYTGRIYGDSKIDAEEICRTYSEKGLPVVILRPSIVYGPYSQLWTSKIAQRLQSGRWGIFKGIGEGKCNLVYIEDLLHAILLALNSERAAGQTFNINGPDIISWNEYFQRFNRALGLPDLSEITVTESRLRAAWTGPIKLAARYILSHFGSRVARLYQRSDLARRIMQRTESSLSTVPSAAELSQFSRKVYYSFSKATRLLGYQPRYNVDAGLEMSVQWLRHELLLPQTNMT
jgi:nucleoside-diphosphate-sugar epimerase